MAADNLRDAAFREDDTPGPGGRSKRCLRAVEQRADRRADQQTEDPQACHVWPRRRRSAPRSHDAAVGKDLHQESIRPAKMAPDRPIVNPRRRRGRRVRPRYGPLIVIVAGHFGVRFWIAWMHQPASGRCRVSGMASIAIAAMMVVAVTYQAGDVGSPVAPIR